MAEDTKKDTRRETSKNTGEKRKDDNVVFIGSKPFMNYVHSVEMQFKKGNNEVIIKARGKFISRAVDVAEYTKRTMKDDKVDLKKIETSTEEFKNKEGRDVNVSTIEITLGK